VGAFVVYDITRPPTFEAVQRWKSDIENKVFLGDDTPIPCVLLANKCDLADKINKSKKEMDEFCREQGFVGWFETSAKENTNIHEAVRYLVEKILKNHRTMVECEEDGRHESLNLEDIMEPKSTGQKKDKSGCC